MLLLPDLRLKMHSLVCVLLLIYANTAHYPYTTARSRCGPFFRLADLFTEIWPPKKRVSLLTNRSGDDDMALGVSHAFSKWQVGPAL